MIAAISVSELATSVASPCESTSEIASTSDVRRAMIQPARCCEKYRSESPVRCSKRSSRSSSTIDWPMRARPRIIVVVSTQATALTAR